MTWTLLIALPLAALVALFAIRPLRRTIVTRPIFAGYRKMLPQMSQTEREALEAGSVWWDADLFTGRPDWKKLLAYPATKAQAAARTPAGTAPRAGRAAAPAASASVQATPFARW